MTSLELPCLVCGKPVTITETQAGRLVDHDWHCERPQVRLQTDNPKHLGVITALDYHGGEE